MKVLSRPNEPAPWTQAVGCPHCATALEIGTSDLFHCAVLAEPFSVDCCECRTTITLVAALIPEDVKRFVAARAALARMAPRVM